MNLGEQSSAFSEEKARIEAVLGPVTVCHSCQQWRPLRGFSWVKSGSGNWGNQGMRHCESCAPLLREIEALRRENIELREKRAVRRHKRETAPSVVYFIADGDLIKIGVSSRGALSRLSEFATGNPRPLHVLLEMPGTPEDEDQLHQRFDSLRVHPDREWFRAEPELLAFIEQQQAAKAA